MSSLTSNPMQPHEIEPESAPEPEIAPPSQRERHPLSLSWLPKALLSIHHSLYLKNLKKQKNFQSWTCSRTCSSPDFDRQRSARMPFYWKQSFPLLSLPLPDSPPVLQQKTHRLPALTLRGTPPQKLSVQKSCLRQS